MKNPFDLTGTVAIVTGSSRGIGRASAELLASLGAKVVISSRKADACDKVAADINTARGAEVAFPIPCKINYKETLQALIDRTRAKRGKIAGLW